MNLNECIKRVEAYLDKSDNHPRVININDIESLKIFKEHFKVGENIFLDVSRYSTDDENPSIDKLLNDLSILDNNIFLTEISTYLKLKGDDEVSWFLNHVLHSSFNNKVIVICYQCDRNLLISDGRLNRLIYNVESKATRAPDLVFVKDFKFIPENQIHVVGIENLANVIESYDVDKIYVNTKKNKDNYKHAIYNIIEQNSPFKILCSKDDRTNLLDESMGSYEQWINAVEKINIYGSWYSFISKIIGSCNGLDNFASSWKYYDENKRWIYFIALKLFGVENNWCLSKAVKNSKNENELERNIYRCLLDEQFDYKSKGFWDKYSERKQLLEAWGKNAKEINDYCNIVKSKGEDIIYFLTDITEEEKQLIFEYLDKNADDSNEKEILEILKNIYPDLFYYLSPFWFDNHLLDEYFQKYKYQKVANKIFPEFKKLVEKQALERDFNLLPARASKIEEIEKENIALYFIDALGVEFLSYISEKCKENNLLTSTTVCVCELPSLTRYNKDFIEDFSSKGSKLIGGKKGIKDLDDIKHNGINGYNYENTKLPIHLIGELEVMENIIKKIDTDLSQGKYDRAVIISDHGASRLAVINKNENKWEMQTKGEHSGRCCPKNEIDEKPDFAIEENDYWILANYDRFRGGRKSDVEVHGGASLEEVLIPIIEITPKKDNIEITIITKKIKFSVRDKNAFIKFYSTYKIHDVRVRINGTMYKAITKDNQTFKVKLPDLNKAMKYKVEVYSGNNLLQNDIEFEAEKEGFATRKLF